MFQLPTTYDGARRPAPSIEWSRPARPALEVSAALDRVRRAPSILLAMRTLPGLTAAVERSVRDGRSSESIAAPLREAIADPRDTVTGLAAVHGLALVPGAAADDELSRLISDGAPAFAQHAMWAMADRAPTLAAILPLARTVAGGGMAGWLAQRVLAQWTGGTRDASLAALETLLRQTDALPARRYLVETIGLLPGRYPGLSLERIALDPDEPMAVRVAAIVAFAERTAELLPRGISELEGRGDELAQAVRTVRARRSLRRRGPRRDGRRDGGLRIAQIHLAAGIDPDAVHAGAGEAGGVATLLARLASVLGSRPGITEVVTIARALPHEPEPTSRTGPNRRDERIPLAPGEGATFTSRWPAVVDATRGIRSALLAGVLPDVMHLRMADPGSLAGAIVARELAIPTVFTLAPDPHGPIASAESSGAIDRQTFARADATGALWYRANLVERLARSARELVLFPRPDLARQLHQLTGVDVHAGRPRHTIVPEGIDTARIDGAADRIGPDHAAPPVVAELERAITALPEERHGRPLVLSVGRLHEGKGMARLVAAFAIDEELAARANLVIVGGDLDDPSPAEEAELARIRRLLDRHAGLAERVILLGHRPNADVAVLLATARAGWGRSIAGGGIFASGSSKEEFGLAIVEALAAGLPVVAPRDGGPVTYVDHDVTGVLVDATDTRALARGMHRTLDLARDAETATRARSTVEGRYTLEHMARTLAAVYRVAAGATSLARPPKSLEGAHLEHSGAVRPESHTSARLEQAA